MEKLPAWLETLWNVNPRLAEQAQKDISGARAVINEITETLAERAEVYEKAMMYENNDQEFIEQMQVGMEAFKEAVGLVEGLAEKLVDTESKLTLADVSNNEERVAVNCHLCKNYGNFNKHSPCDSCVIMCENFVAIN